MEYQDINCVCVDCKNSFIWEAGQQKWINEKHQEYLFGKNNPNFPEVKEVVAPKRCWECKALRQTRFNSTQGRNY